MASDTHRLYGRGRWLSALLVAGLTLAACGGSPESAKQTKASPAGGPSPAAAAAEGDPRNTPFQGMIASAEVLVGKSRFAAGVLDPRTKLPLPDAEVTFRFYELQGNQGTLRAEAPAVFRAPAREAGLATAIEHKHIDGSLHIHSNVEGDIGVYTAEVAFEKAGEWGVEALVKAKDGRQGGFRLPFTVLATSKVPMVGQPALKSKQPLVGDVQHISAIDSSAEPIPELHTITIADAVASGKPSLIAFVSPGYCSSRICGPSLEIIKRIMQKPEYAGKVNFIHIEVYKDFEKLTPSDTFREWNLSSEPWFFIVDGKGVINARFDGPTAGSELEGALKGVLGG